MFLTTCIFFLYLLPTPSCSVMEAAFSNIDKACMCTCTRARMYVCSSVSVCVWMCGHDIALTAGDIYKKRKFTDAWANYICDVVLIIHWFVII